MARKQKKHKSREDSSSLECGDLPPLSNTRGGCVGLGALKRGGKPSRFQGAAVCGLLLLAVIAVFGQTARHDFINFDDDDYVYKNEHVMGGLTAAGIGWAFTQFRVSAHWHPLTWLSLMADAQMLRSKEGPPDLPRLAAGMHLVNVALHAINTLLVFLLLRTMTAHLWQSALVAAVFAVHPLHVESVAWITERKDMLSGLFGLLALWAYAWYTRGPSVVRYLLVAAALILGLMAKPMLVTWPLLFLLLDYWPLRRPFSTRLLLEKVPFLLLVAASAAVTFVAQWYGGTVISLESVPISPRIGRAAMLYVAYLGKSAWPANLAAVYPVTPMESYWPAIGAGTLLLLLTAGTLWGAWRGQRWLAVGWFWFLGTLAPTIGLVQVGSELMADRFLYLPQIGICLAVAWAAGHAAGCWRCPRSLLASVSALLLACLSVCAWRQTSYWRDSEQLWTRTLACDGNNDIAQTCLGNILARQGRIDEAIAHYRQALEIKPDHAEAYVNLGKALASRGQLDEAIALDRKALEIKPGHIDVQLNLAVALAGRGQLDEAIALYRKVLEIKPDFAEAHNNLGNALAGRGEIDKAIFHYRKALEIEPGYAEVHNNLGTALAGQGQSDEAIAHYRKALEIRPDYAEAHSNLGVALKRQGQVDEAIDQYRQALEIKPDYVEAHNNLGNALAGRGQFDEAIVQYRRALEIDPGSMQSDLLLADALARCGRPGEALPYYQAALGLAVARRDTARADALRTRIRMLQTIAPGKQR